MRAVSALLLGGLVLAGCGGLSPGSDAAPPDGRALDAAPASDASVTDGGAWSLGTIPYDSNAAISNAYAIGMEGVKIDVRVSSDDVPVIAHSSPIAYYESWDCGLLGLKIPDAHRRRHGLVPGHRRQRRLRRGPAARRHPEPAGLHVRVRPGD